MARIKGYTGAPSQETIDANIVDKERKMVQCLLKASKWNKSGATVDNWLIKADVQSLEIHTLNSKCDDKTYEFVDESLEEGCKGGIGIGFMKIQPTTNVDGCPIFTIKGVGQVEPPYGEFSYCEFVTSEFTEVVGTPPVCSEGVILVDESLNALEDELGNLLELSFVE